MELRDWIMVAMLAVTLFVLTVYDHPKQVHTYKDPATSCEYLYTNRSSLVAREDGDGNHMGCYSVQKTGRML